MKKRYSVMLAIAIFVLICASQAFAATTFKFAGQNPVDQQSTKQMERVRDAVLKATNNEVNMKVFPASQLGDYLLVYEELMRGTIDFALISTSNQFDDRLMLCYATFLVKDYNEAKKFYKKGSWLYKVIDEAHASKKVKFLGFNAEGMGGIGTVKPAKDPLNPDVSQGLLIRCPPNDNAKNTLEAIGYKTVTIPYAETFTALQTGVADGWFGGSPVHSYMGFRDVIKNYYSLNLYVEVTHFLASKKTWDKLTPAQQKIIEDAVDKASVESFGISEREDKEYLDKMAAMGIKVYNYSDKQLAPLFKKGRSIAWPKLEALVGKKLIGELEKEAEKLGK